MKKFITIIFIGILFLPSLKVIAKESQNKPERKVSQEESRDSHYQMMNRMIVDIDKLKLKMKALKQALGLQFECKSSCEGKSDGIIIVIYGFGKTKMEAHQNASKLCVSSFLGKEIPIDSSSCYDFWSTSDQF